MSPSDWVEGGTVGWEPGGGEVGRFKGYRASAETRLAHRKHSLPREC